ncbi:MAG: hypothetical protein R2855_05580 [Thermomicrobiales bacterium]
MFEGSRISPETADTTNARRRAAILTGAVGALFAILFLTSLWLLSQAPRPGSDAQSFIDFYNSSERRKIVLVGLYVLPFSAIAFIWFLAALRQWVAQSHRRGSQLVGTVQLLSGVGFIILALASAAASTMPAALAELSDQAIDPEMARDFPLYGNALLLVFGVRLSAMFVMTTTNIGRASGYMPKWFAYIGYVVAAVLFLSYSLTVWLAVVFPLWVLGLGLLIIFLAYESSPESLAESLEPPGQLADEI